MSKIKLGLMLLGLGTLLCTYPGDVLDPRASNNEFWMGLGVVVLVGLGLMIFIVKSPFRKK